MNLLQTVVDKVPEAVSREFILKMAERARDRYRVIFTVGDLLGYAMGDADVAERLFPRKKMWRKWQYQPMPHGRQLWAQFKDDGESFTQIIQIRRKYLERFTADIIGDRCYCEYDCCGHWFVSSVIVLHKVGRFAYVQVNSARNL